MVHLSLRARRTTTITSTSLQVDSTSVLPSVAFFGSSPASPCYKSSPSLLSESLFGSRAKHSSKILVTSAPYYAVPSCVRNALFNHPYRQISGSINLLLSLGTSTHRLRLQGSSRKHNRLRLERLTTRLLDISGDTRHRSRCSTCSLPSHFTAKRPRFLRCGTESRRKVSWRAFAARSSDWLLQRCSHRLRWKQYRGSVQTRSHRRRLRKSTEQRLKRIISQGTIYELESIDNRLKSLNSKTSTNRSQKCRPITRIKGILESTNTNLACTILNIESTDFSLPLTNPSQQSPNNCPLRSLPRTKSRKSSTDFNLPRPDTPLFSSFATSTPTTNNPTHNPHRRSRNNNRLPSPRRPVHRKRTRQPRTASTE